MTTPIPSKFKRKKQTNTLPYNSIFDSNKQKIENYIKINNLKLVFVDQFVTINTLLNQINTNNICYKFDDILKKDVIELCVIMFGHNKNVVSFVTRNFTSDFMITLEENIIKILFFKELIITSLVNEVEINYNIGKPKDMQILYTKYPFLNGLMLINPIITDDNYYFFKFEDELNIPKVKIYTLYTAQGRRPYILFIKNMYDHSYNLSFISLSSNYLAVYFRTYNYL